MINLKINYWKKDLLPLFPEKIKNILYHVEDHYPLEELRLRANLPLQLCGGATAHADSMDALRRRKSILCLLESGAIERIFLLHRRGTQVGCLEGVYDMSLQAVKEKRKIV